MRLAGLDHLQGGGDRVVAAGQPAPAQQQPAPFELVARLADAALDARRRVPVEVEELADLAALRVNELGQRQTADLVGQGAPGRIVVDLVPGQHRLEQVHVRVRLQRRGRRVGLVEAAQRVLALGVQHVADMDGDRLGLGLTVRQRLGHGRQGEHGESLVVGIGGVVEALAIWPDQGAEQAVGPAIGLQVEGQAMGDRLAPRAGPAQFAGQGVGKDLPGQHAAATRAVHRMAVEIDLLEEAALHVVGAGLPPQRIGGFQSPGLQAVAQAGGVGEGGHRELQRIAFF